MRRDLTKRAREREERNANLTYRGSNKRPAVFPHLGNKREKSDGVKRRDRVAKAKARGKGDWATRDI